MRWNRPVGPVKDTPRNRRLVVAWATLGFIPGFVVCSFMHWCMCGHMAHEQNHTLVGVANDVVWTTLFAMAVVFVGKSDAHGKSWIRYGLSLAVLLTVIMLPVGVLWLPVVAFFAVWSLFSGSCGKLDERSPRRKTLERWGRAALILWCLGLIVWLFWALTR